MPINSFLYPGAKTTPAYEVDNSCRFDGSSAVMEKTFGSAGNRDTFTLSCWVKRSGLGTTQRVIGWKNNGGGYGLIWEDTDQLKFLITATGSNAAFTTNRLFRDVSAWYHIVLKIDTTQATEADRMRVYINGVEETSFASRTYPNQNEDTHMNLDNKCRIGCNPVADNSYFSGYLAEVCFIDGSALAPTSFGEFDEDSPQIWKPIDVSGLTFGSNGFYLDFEDSGDLGDDESGNGNDFTEANLAATDQSTDTPTNNFATWNPLAQTPQKGTIAEGNLEYDRSGSSDNWVTIASTIAATAGKWYYEYKIIDGGSSTGNGSLVGFLDYNTSAFQHTANDAITNAGEYAWYGASGNLYINGTDVAQVDSYTDDDIVMVAMDLDNSKAYWGKNGTWIDSGDPTSGATGTGARDIANVSSGTFAFAVSHREGGNGQANFGNPPFSISSGNADDNDYGNFEYDVPTGYLALCTKNLGSDGG